MPYKSNSTNKQSKDNLGDPTGTGQSKAGFKPVNPESESDLHEELGEKYVDAEDEQGINVKLGSNPNRNTNKTSIDKPTNS